MAEAKCVEGSSWIYFVEVSNMVYDFDAEHDGIEL
jgi:hypothetical protein